MIENRYKFITGKISDNILKDKEAMIRNIIFNMLNKTLRMFNYKGLPDTIPEKDLEIILQVNGNATITKVDGKLYAFVGGLGGVHNPYYLPTLSIVANPSLKFNKSLEIDKDCVVMLNDYLYQGLMPTHNKYGRLLAEAEISLKQALFNARIPVVVQADNDNAKASADKFFEDVENGMSYKTIINKSLLDGLKIQNFYNQPYIKDLIEATQYIKGSWYSEIGLNATFNLKREAVNESETRQNDDILSPPVDTMLECRKKALEKINTMYGTNITVEYDSSWYFRNKEQELNLDILESEREDEDENSN